ncbi:MAG TPA: PadR family transcriptional regulator [Vicinamibacterales bacterium]|jgi:PadR family transcriptional regulator PadR|nr:PadR family transcriptional regulator [Vicinamibacterales bacterium]
MAKGDFVGDFELLVLLAIAHAGDEAYGLAIQQQIEQRTGRIVAIGAVHATLGRLADKGLVRYRVSEPQPIPGGKRRKFYRLCPAGVRAIRHSTGMLARMLNGLSPDLTEPQ